MPKIKEFSFFLKDAQADKPTLINFRMPIPGDEPLKRSIGRSIHPDQWDFEDQRPHPGKDKAIKEIDQLIDRISETIPVIKSECRRNNRVITRADVDGALDVILQLKRKEKPADHTPGRSMFIDFKVIIEGMRSGEILTPGKNKKQYSGETIKNFEKSTRKVKAFYEDENKKPERRKRPLLNTWGMVDIELYNSFVAWCHVQNQSNNSIGVFVKCWKRLGKIALKKGWHTNLVFEDEDFLILKEETDDIALDDHKIGVIYKVSVPAKYYDIARDWFVLDCYLGLRVSDLGKVSINDFSGKHFQFINQKTGAKVAIPIHSIVKKIIRKWKGLPPAITDQKLNEYIKVVAKLAKLKDKFLYKITKGGKVHQEILEEWQMISSHTCRRSFITRLLAIRKPEPIPHAVIMLLVGIKRYETLMRYFKMTAEKAAESVADHGFFK